MRLHPGRLRRRDLLWRVPIGPGLRRRRTELVRHDAMHAQDLRAARCILRRGVRRVQQHGVLRDMPKRAGLRRGRAEPMQLRADDVPGAGRRVRHDSGWLRWAIAVRDVPEQPDLRRGWRQPVRHHTMYADHMRGPGGSLRDDLRWLQWTPGLPNLSVGSDLQHPAPVCLLAGELRVAGSRMRQPVRRVRLDPGLRDVSRHQRMQRDDPPMRMRSRDLCEPGVGMWQRAEWLRGDARLRALLG